MPYEDKLEKAAAHTIALEQNQMALQMRISDLKKRLQEVTAEYQASVMREAALQTEVNELKHELKAARACE